MRLALALFVIAACGKSSSDKVSREQCTQVADQAAAIIMDHYRSHPDEMWDVIHSKSDKTDLPETVTKETFKSYLDTPQGKTWLMEALGAVRVGTEQVIDNCMKTTPKHVACLLAAKTTDDLKACDKVPEADPKAK